MYQIFFGKDGSKKHDINRFSKIAYWNDACWHRGIPKDTTGLTYLDVGSHAGLFCLRFEQRGGAATGLDYYLSEIVHNGSTAPSLGKEHPVTGDTYDAHDEYLWVKKEYKSRYKLLCGGFDEGGNIIPDLGKYSIISCMNVLEYLPNAQACIDGMFAKATDRVIVSTDINPFGPTARVTDLPPMHTLCGLDDVVSWMPWPTSHWLLDIGGGEGHSRYQLFIVATNPDSKLAPVAGEDVTFDTDCWLSETQKFFMHGG